MHDKTYTNKVPGIAARPPYLEGCDTANIGLCSYAVVFRMSSSSTYADYKGTLRDVCDHDHDHDHDAKSWGRRKAKRETPPITVLRVLTQINPTALLRGNVRHELVHCPIERVLLLVVVVLVVVVVAVVVLVLLIGGKSVIAVSARCTDVRANKLLVGMGCCVPYME